MTPPAAAGQDREELTARYRETRAQSELLCRPLETEDYGVQSMPDVSPAKWHLAHTSWFFETFLLAPFAPDYRPFHPQFGYLFNSYYETMGRRHPRGERGLCSRPTVSEIYRYRRHVDAGMRDVLQASSGEDRARIVPLLTLGLHHEQQHQELLLTDIKHVFATNPLRPVYRERRPGPDRPAGPPEWREYDGGITETGHGGAGFAFDNESPRHRVFLQAYRLASRLVTNGEYLAFMADGGYGRPEVWLSEGWKTVQERRWDAPLYWERVDGAWWNMTLAGARPVAESEPVCHVSYFEADAFARWAGKRLPGEAEWENAASGCPVTGNLIESGEYHPARAPANGPGLTQLFGDVWEWTASPYVAYPGFRPAGGAVGEYNGKFMCNQWVLRGGSCATPRSHIRPTYRNFFPADARWQFSGIRLAE
jgi:ergothioneine biosynthesis protein EgtB